MHPRDVVLVLEYLGYCLIKNSSLFQKALMLAGPPDQAKSKFVESSETLLGKQNGSHKTMRQLTEDSFLELRYMENLQTCLLI